MKRMRRDHSPEFRAKVALKAAREEKTIAELAPDYGVQANQTSAWERQLLVGASSLFAPAAERNRDSEAASKELLAKIGELTIERDFLSKALRLQERRSKIDKEHNLSVTQQCEPLKVNRSRVYYSSVAVPAADLEVMRVLDEIHPQAPVPRPPPPGRRTDGEGLRGQQEALASPDLNDGREPQLPGSAHHQARFRDGSQDLPVPAERAGRRPPEPRVGHGSWPVKRPHHHNRPTPRTTREPIIRPLSQWYCD